MQLLYLIECQGYFKIGVAYDVQRRLAELATGNPFELNVRAVYGYNNAQVVEAALHQKFSAGWKRGEWFSMNDQDLQDFHMLCQGLGGMEMPFTAVVEEDEIEEIENESLDAQHRVQQRKRDQKIKIIDLYSQGKSQAQIEREVFGYSGGHAAVVVSETIKQHKNLEGTENG
jgi:hypothetical protein